MPMEIDENNVASASIEFNSGDPVWYRILLVDGKQGFAASDVKQFEGTGISKDKQDSSGIGIVGIICALFVALNRRKD